MPWGHFSKKYTVITSSQHISLSGFYTEVLQFKKKDMDQPLYNM